MLGLAVLSLGGCGPGNVINFGGVSVWQQFPFDGDRSWEYINVDNDIPYKLRSNTVGDPDVIGGINVYTVEYWSDCIGDDPTCIDEEVLRRVKWSSTSSDGVRIHSAEAGSTIIDFDPPMQLAFDQMERDQVAGTNTAGANWTGTFIGLEDCPVRFTTEWTDCGHFLVETDAAAGGEPVAGEYWAVVGQGVVAIELEGQTRWELADADCEGDCDGSW